MPSPVLSAVARIFPLHHFFTSHSTFGPRLLIDIRQNSMSEWTLYAQSFWLTSYIVLNPQAEGYFMT